MNTESWERAKHAFHAAIDAEPAQQAATIASLCGSDEDARTQATRMLAHAEPHRPATPPDGDHHAGPRMIGRFEVLRLVGTGATGKVYAARDPETDRTVAIKILRLNVDTESMRRRLEYEGTVLAGLDHPNIARVHETGIATTEFGTLPYIVMQYVEGTAIDTFADDHALDDRARVELVAHACAAVAHAHGRGVIHRDIKPTNIIVDRTSTPLLIDFGIASHTAALSDIDSLATQTRDLLGTPGYMSPEQRHGAANAVDTRTDVYALGIILYELLARRRMFDVAGLPLIAALETMETSPVPLLSDARPLLPRPARGHRHQGHPPQPTLPLQLRREPGRRPRPLPPRPGTARPARHQRLPGTAVPQATPRRAHDLARARAHARHRAGNAARRQSPRRPPPRLPLPSDCRRVRTILARDRTRPLRDRRVTIHRRRPPARGHPNTLRRHRRQVHRHPPTTATPPPGPTPSPSPAPNASSRPPTKSDSAPCRSTPKRLCMSNQPDLALRLLTEELDGRWAFSPDTPPTPRRRHPVPTPPPARHDPGRRPGKTRRPGRRGSSTSAPCSPHSRPSSPVPNNQTTPTCTTPPT
ncbi:MAG: serine/threonine protein kinase [Planctomycetota bacterium]|nr:MAG: serine/threonine protein kinase [Planctomycetota bacterium]